MLFYRKICFFVLLNLRRHLAHLPTSLSFVSFFVRTKPQDPARTQNTQKRKKYNFAFEKSMKYFVRT